jgi:hypothetical protein
MAYDFVNKTSFTDMMNISLLSLGEQLNSEDVKRLSDYRKKWNFYEGYHWEDIPPSGKAEVTKNYCRAFVNKFVAFELGKGFSIKMKPQVEEAIVPYLNEVWDDNKKEQFCLELGQTKSVTGDAWIQVTFQPKFNDDGTLNPNFYDPYDEYEKGRVRVIVVPPHICFPEYDDGYDKEVMRKFTIMYPIRQNPDEPSKTRTLVYKQVWYRDRVEVYYGKDLAGTYVNKYGIIPFFHCKNLPLAGRNTGASDLDDLIPLNVELNLKSSDVSEIIDYHSAPVTVVYGARIGQLEKGANKVWGGLPKDGKVENLELRGDLSASTNYIKDLKQAMHEIGGIPEGALGKETAISNTSGVALQVTMLPLIEKVQQKRALTAQCLREVNKFIIKIGLEEGLIDADLSKWRKDDRYSKDIYQNEIIFEDNLPKDKLVEIQAIQLEMKLGLEDREGGMKRLGKKDIQRRLEEIDRDREKYPEIYGLPTEEEKEAMKQNLEIKKKQSKEKDIMKRDLNVNKANNDGQVNAGFTNSPEKQQSTNS